MPEDGRALGSFRQETSLSIDLTDELRAELLHPDAWSSILSLYASTMKLAVALFDADGHMVGPCHNPQPVWTLARQAKPKPMGDCAFCLESGRHCTARASATESRRMTLAHDQSPASLMWLSRSLWAGR